MTTGEMRKDAAGLYTPGDSINWDTGYLVSHLLLVGAEICDRLDALRRLLNTRVWFAAGGGICRKGPYPTQRAAWESMRLDKPGPGSPFPDDTHVWPEYIPKEPGP